MKEPEGQQRGPEGPNPILQKYVELLEADLMRRLIGQISDEEVARLASEVRDRVRASWSDVLPRDSWDREETRLDRIMKRACDAFISKLADRLIEEAARDAVFLDRVRESVRAILVEHAKARASNARVEFSTR